MSDRPAATCSAATSTGSARPAGSRRSGWPRSSGPRSGRRPGPCPAPRATWRSGRALLEAKSTTGNSISVSLDWLAKIAREARSDGKTPALTVSYVDDDGRPRPDGDWVLIPLYAFKELFCAEEQP